MKNTILSLSTCSSILLFSLSNAQVPGQVDKKGSESVVAMQMEAAGIQAKIQELVSNRDSLRQQAVAARLQHREAQQLGKIDSHLGKASRCEADAAKLEGQITPLRTRLIFLQSLLGDKSINPNLLVSDPVQLNSIWVGDGPSKVLTITERREETFRGKFEVGDSIIREVSGTIKDGKLSWTSKDVRTVKGGPGGDNSGVVIGNKIEFTYTDTKGQSGSFTLKKKDGSVGE
jgi:hypothetical protein